LRTGISTVALGHPQSRRFRARVLSDIHHPEVCTSRTVIRFIFNSCVNVAFLVRTTALGHSPHVIKYLRWTIRLKLRFDTAANNRKSPWRRGHFARGATISKDRASTLRLATFQLATVPILVAAILYYLYDSLIGPSRISSIQGPIA
jgi:hypothetical protein